MRGEEEGNTEGVRDTSNSLYRLLFLHFFQTSLRSVHTSYKRRGFLTSPSALTHPQRPSKNSPEESPPLPSDAHGSEASERDTQEDKNLKKMIESKCLNGFN